MELTEALTIVVARTGHERLRWLCGPDNPDQAQRDAYVRLVLTLAGAPPPPEPEVGPAPRPTLAQSPDRAAILARRATKPRIKLGEKPPTPPGRR